MKLAVLLVAIAACAPPPPPQPPKPHRLGDQMIEVGMRFARAANAVVAGRWELADYDVDELRELFEAFEPAQWKGNAEETRIAREFGRDNLAALLAATKAHDRAAFDRELARAADVCNACHKAGGKDYIEVAGVAGAEMPLVSTRIRK